MFRFRLLPSLLLGALMMPPSGWVSLPAAPAALYSARRLPSRPSGVPAARREARRRRNRARSRK